MEKKKVHIKLKYFICANHKSQYMQKIHLTHLSTVFALLITYNTPYLKPEQLQC